MVSKQVRGLQSFRRLDAWFVDHPEVIPASGSSAQALTNGVNDLRGVITRMTEQGTEQATQTEQATLVAKDEPMLRSELRTRHMNAIVAVATALRGKVPGIGVMKLPSTRVSSEKLAAAAEALSTTAAIYQNVLIEHGLPRDFIAQLDAAITALRASVDARGLALSKRVGATAAVAEAFDLGKRIVQMIDASLLHALKSEPATLASWRQAKRITVKPTVARVTDIVPVAAAPSTTASTPAMTPSIAA